MIPSANFPAGYTLRPGYPGDAAAIQEIERDADSRFAAVLGAGWAPAWQPSSSEELVEAAQQAALFVIAPVDGPPCGYLWMEPLEGAGQIAELAVTRAHGRKGLGRLLLATAEAWAARRGFAALTLTTFRDVPWNAPFYGRCGFMEISPEGALADILLAERTQFAAPRIAMRRALES